MTTKIVKAARGGRGILTDSPTHDIANIVAKVQKSKSSSVDTITDNVRERLGTLLNSDLAFKNNGKSPIHSIHAFAARFPPQLPRLFIDGLTNPGDTVLDPMSGSGVTITEAWLLDRNAIGVDLDPLALRISRVKTTPYFPELLRKAGDLVISQATAKVRADGPAARLLEGYEKATLKFINFWFAANTQKELAALTWQIAQEPVAEIREFLEVVFSSTIVTKTGGVSMARDLAHTRPHRVNDKVPKSALVKFEVQLSKAIRAIQERQTNLRAKSLVIPGDCRCLPLPDSFVDLIVTSPPYANAIDYMRAHKFSLVWLGKEIKELSTLRGSYIGSENCGQLNDLQLPNDILECLSRLGEIDRRKADILQKYFQEMRLSLEQMYRVLKKGKVAVLVVGPSIMRGMPIETHAFLASLAVNIGFNLVGNVRRPLDRDRRMMPARLSQNNDSTMIEQRMHEEFVIGLIKE